MCQSIVVKDETHLAPIQAALSYYAFQTLHIGGDNEYCAGRQNLPHSIQRPFGEVNKMHTSKNTNTQTQTPIPTDRDRDRHRQTHIYRTTHDLTKEEEPGTGGTGETVYTLQTFFLNIIPNTSIGCVLLICSKILVQQSHFVVLTVDRTNAQTRARGGEGWGGMGWGEGWFRSVQFPNEVDSSTHLTDP